MKYKTIYADPPWLERGAGKCKRGADRHYSLMSLDSIKSWFSQNVIENIDDNCHLYLWVTNNHLEEGLDLMKWLGFRYITNIIWVKDKIGLGQYFRGQHEILLFGVKGDFYSGSRKETTVIYNSRDKHSKKPYGVYKKIENVSLPPRLECFSRHKREGWDCIGNETPIDTQKILNLDILNLN